MTAERIWAELIGRGWALLEDWKAAGRTEDLHLEFKQSVSTKHVAVAMSAFGNVEGGVIVLGVQTTKVGGVDTVTALMPSESAEVVAGQINETSRDFTVPILPGVRAMAVMKPGEPKGAVAVYVPLRDDMPFQVASDRRYMMRTTRGTEGMPHQILASLFGTLPAPQLALRVRTWLANNEIVLDFRLLNSGRGAARRPAVLIENFANQFRLPASHLSSSGFEMVNAVPVVGRGRVLFEARDVVLYPGMDRGVFFGHFGFVGPPRPTSLDVTATLHALDAQPRAGVLTVAFDPDHPGTPTEPRVFTMPAEVA